MTTSGGNMLPILSESDKFDGTNWAAWKDNILIAVKFSGVWIFRRFHHSPYYFRTKGNYRYNGSNNSTDITSRNTMAFTKP